MRVSECIFRAALHSQGSQGVRTGSDHCYHQSPGRKHDLKVRKTDDDVGHRGDSWVEADCLKPLLRFPHPDLLCFLLTIYLSVCVYMYMKGTKYKVLKMTPFYLQPSGPLPQFSVQSSFCGEGYTVHSQKLTHFLSRLPCDLTQGLFPH